MSRATVFSLALLAAGPALSETAPVGARVEVNGMQMYYEVSGQGDPLVVLHGAYMNIPSMGGIIPKLAETHTVYALEFQGHGRTTDVDRPITYPGLADDVAAFMDAVDVPKADVFGYSMGAAAGLQLAIRHQEKVDQLIAASVAYDVGGWQPAFRDFIPMMTVLCPWKSRISTTSLLRPGLIGRRSIHRSWAPCLSAGSTQTSAANSAPITPTGTRS